MAFDPAHALNVVLPLAQAAVTAMDGDTPVLPSGYVVTAPLLADPAHAATVAGRAAVHAMMKNTNVFGLLGQDPAAGTAFVSFRGSADVSDWIADFDALPTDYAPLPHFGQVHTGFQDVYECVRADLAAKLPAATAGCQRLLITGHSLGGALAVLAGPDVARAMPPNTIEPRLVTFAGPRVGLADFAAAFGAAIECCYRVVNFLDIVPLVPPSPYVQVGTGVTVDSGGTIDLGFRHSLAAYRAGLAKLVAAAA